jgi:paraquat-inducible protein B
MRIRDIKMEFVVQDDKQEVFCGQKVMFEGLEIGKVVGAEFLDSGYGVKINADITSELYFNGVNGIKLENWKPIKVNKKQKETNL